MSQPSLRARNLQVRARAALGLARRYCTVSINYAACMRACACVRARARVHACARTHARTRTCAKPACARTHAYVCKTCSSECSGVRRRRGIRPAPQPTRPKTASLAIGVHEGIIPPYARTHARTHAHIRARLGIIGLDYVHACTCMCARAYVRGLGLTQHAPMRLCSRFNGGVGWTSTLGAHGKLNYD